MEVETAYQGVCWFLLLCLVIGTSEIERQTRTDPWTWVEVGGEGARRRMGKGGQRREEGARADAKQRQEEQ